MLGKGLSQQEKDTRRNIAFYSMKEGAYFAAMPFVNGTLVQLFLAHKGVPAERIGLFNTVVYVTNIATTMLLSNLAEKRPNALRQCDRLILLQALLYLAYLPAALLPGLGSNGVFWILMPAASVQIVLYACKYIYEYKLFYQIIDVNRLGMMESATGIGIGVMGILCSTFCAALIERGTGDAPFLIGMLLSAALLVAAFACNRSLRVVNHTFDEERRAPMGFSQVFAMMREPIFRRFVVPNTLRGVTIGITNSIALIALGMGYSEVVTAKLAVMCAGGYIVASFAYYFMDRWFRQTTICLIGSALLMAILFLPRSNDTLFLVLFLIAYFGRVLVDHGVPVMVFRMIDPEIAGAYNAWRNVLSSLTAAGVSYAVGALIGRVPPLALLIPCAGAYGASMVWYALLYRKYERHAGAQG